MTSYSLRGRIILFTSHLGLGGSRFVLKSTVVLVISEQIREPRIKSYFPSGIYIYMSLVGHGSVVDICAREKKRSGQACIRSSCPSGPGLQQWPLPASPRSSRTCSPGRAAERQVVAGSLSNRSSLPLVRKRWDFSEAEQGISVAKGTRK